MKRKLILVALLPLALSSCGFGDKGGEEAPIDTSSPTTTVEPSPEASETTTPVPETEVTPDPELETEPPVEVEPVWNKRISPPGHSFVVPADWRKLEPAQKPKLKEGMVLRGVWGEQDGNFATNVNVIQMSGFPQNFDVGSKVFAKRIRLTAAESGGTDLQMKKIPYGGVKAATVKMTTDKYSAFQVQSYIVRNGLLTVVTYTVPQDGEGIPLGQLTSKVSKSWKWK